MTSIYLYNITWNSLKNFMPGISSAIQVLGEQLFHHQQVQFHVVNSESEFQDKLDMFKSKSW